MPFRSLTSGFSLRSLPLLLGVLAVGMFTTAVAFHALRSAEHDAARIRYERTVAEAVRDLGAQLQNYERLLRSGAALFAASESVSREDWHAFALSQRLGENFPGLQAFAYAEVLAADALPAHEARLRAQGFPGYAVHPRGVRDHYSPVVYLEPFSARSLRVIGFDMGSEPIRRAAMEAARDAGQPALSGRVTLIYDRHGAAPPAGVLMYMPVYRHAAPLDTLAQRRAALQGFVYVPFRVPDLANAALGHRIDGMRFELHAGPRPGAAPLYRHPDQASDDGEAPASFDTLRQIDVGLQTWTLRFATLAAFDAAQPSSKSAIVAAAGSLLTLMASVLILALTGTRARAERLARDFGALNEAILASAPFCVIATDIDGLVTSINPAGERLLQYTREELVGRVTPAVLHVKEEVDARAAELARRFGQTVEGFEVFVACARRDIAEEREWTYLRRDGTRVPVNLVVSALHDAAGQVSGFLGIAYDITERKRQQESIRHLAHHDALTGLPNRALMADRVSMAIERAKRHGGKVAVMLIDLDHFKHVNDSLGHHVGDEVLTLVAQRLEQAVRQTDTVARMGGDEFVIVLGDLDAREASIRVADKIVALLTRELQAGGHALHLSPSIGIALYPDHGADLTALLRNADAAMYETKAKGRNGHTLFTEGLQRNSLKRIGLEARLRRALEQGQFSVHYQPIVKLRREQLADGEPVAVEALLRWTDPEQGPVAPDLFIPFAEESGLIVPIGEWVLRQACLELRQLRDRTGAALSVAVNLSPRQFRQGNLVALVEEALRDAGLSPECLELEITEGVLMEDPIQARKLLQALRGIGVRVAVDDFGTGYSSLSYLSRFSVDKLKLDRSFVRHITTQTEDATIASTVVQLGRSLGLQVVAEGVETLEQARFLAERDCQLAQGYLYARPMPIDLLCEWLRERRPFHALHALHAG